MLPKTKPVPQKMVPVTYLTVLVEMPELWQNFSLKLLNRVDSEPLHWRHLISFAEPRLFIPDPKTTIREKKNNKFR
jgi:hypothetical protein